ncbi:hypothetical protein [Kitasatospora sp. NPDC056181]|uniref:hypothetical protein n=1 Tax=Kitasatospora sp. NPDC056181 TaxID=3345737 RepID=UPI0035DCBE44
MVIEIAPLAALIIGVGFVVGVLVYKSTGRSACRYGQGDLTASIGCGAAVAAALAVLLAPGFGQSTATPAVPTAPTAVSAR